MDPLNGTLDRNRDRLNRFLEELGRVEDLQDHLQLDKYLALGKTQEVIINISLNEIYSIHALMKEHLDGLVRLRARALSFVFSISRRGSVRVVKTSNESESHSTLRDLMQTLGPPPAQLPRKDNANVDLVLDKSILGQGMPLIACPLSLSLTCARVCANCFLCLDENPRFKTENDQLYSETKYLLFMVLKELPNLLVDRNTSDNVRELLRMADDAARKVNNVTLIETLDSIRSNCQYLVQEGLLSEADDFEQLRKDAFEVRSRCRLRSAPPRLASPRLVSPHGARVGVAELRVADRQDDERPATPPRGDEEH